MAGEPLRERPKNLVAFGMQVRGHRLAAGLSQEQLGAKLPVSGTYIGKIERGETRCQRKVARRLDEIFGLPGSLEQLWEDLDLSAPFPLWFDWHREEAEALRLLSYQCLVVDGLLQTEDYARALLGGNEEAVAARMSRQEVLTREEPEPPRLLVLLTKGVLLNPVGDKRIMRAQISHLIEVSYADRISVQIISDMVPNGGNSGSFVIAIRRDHSQVAYIATALRGLTLSEPADLHHLMTNYDRIRSEALPAGMSRDFMAKVTEEQWS